MSDDRPVDRFRENATEITSILVTGLWMAALFTGQGWWLAALLVGYVVVVPIVALLFGDEEDRAEWWDEDDSATVERDREATTETNDAPSTGDALETLRERYARGELTDEQFEAKLERLLGTETVENADEWVGERRRGEERRREVERERE